MTELSPKTENWKLSTEVQALQQEAIHFAATRNGPCSRCLGRVAAIDWGKRTKKSSLMDPGVASIGAWCDRGSSDRLSRSFYACE